MIKKKDCIKCCFSFHRKELALSDLCQSIMWGLPDRQPFNIGPYKLWPCFSEPEFQWFAAINGQPHYFRTTNEAKLFVKDLLVMDDPEGLCD